MFKKQHKEQRVNTHIELKSMLLKLHDSHPKRIKLLNLLISQSHNLPTHNFHRFLTVSNKHVSIDSQYRLYLRLAIVRTELV